MTETEKFKRFKKYLMDNHFKGVKRTLEPEFIEKIIHDYPRARPIHSACWNGNFEIVKLLIENKCNIESETETGARPIHYVCQNGKLEIGKLLIENRCNIESEDNMGWRPIHYACKNGQLEIVKLLIKDKCNIESQTKEGMNPIHLACLDGHKDIVKLLIVRKCFIYRPDNNGRTPLDLAKSKGHEEIIQLLLVVTQINYSILNKDDESFAKFYNSDKKYINFKNEKDQTPLQMAIETESMDIAQSLIFGNENIDNVDCEGRTALSQLFEKISDIDKKGQHLEFLNAIKVIISEGGDIYHENSQGVKSIEYCSSVEVRNTIETFFKNKQDKKEKIIIEKEKLVVVKEIEIEKRICGVCLDREVDSVLECGHTICESCSDKILRCPFCKREPVQAKKIYFN